MQKKEFKSVERFSKEKHVHVPLFTSERTKVVLLCLSPGLSVHPHAHPGFEVTLQPLRGKGILPVEGGEDVLLTPGEILFVDGNISFSPKNPFDEEFEMLIHLIKI